MALYRCSFQNITRSEGRSAVAAAAYRAGEKVTNEWDGVTHDFTKKQGVVHSEILLPPEAPAEYKIRSCLWNAVEASEKSIRARLCRECLLTLLVELSQHGFSDQGSIEAAKKEISRRRQEINTLNESLLQFQAEAEDIQQQLSDTLSAVPEQYKSEVLTHEPPKEEKYRGRTR